MQKSSRTKKNSQSHRKERKQTIIPVPKEKRTEPYWDYLNQVVDPETGIGIVDMGIVYRIDLEGDRAIVTITLTTPSCPVGPQIIADIQDMMEQYKNIKHCDVDLVWDPPWSPDKIDEELRMMMFGL